MAMTKNFSAMEVFGNKKFTTIYVLRGEFSKAFKALNCGLFDLDNAREFNVDTEKFSVCFTFNGVNVEEAIEKLSPFFED